MATVHALAAASGTALREQQRGGGGEGAKRTGLCQGARTAVSVAQRRRGHPRVSHKTKKRGRRSGERVVQSKQLDVVALSAALSTAVRAGSRTLRTVASFQASRGKGRRQGGVRGQEREGGETGRGGAKPFSRKTKKSPGQARPPFTNAAATALRSILISMRPCCLRRSSVHYSQVPGGVSASVWLVMMVCCVVVHRSVGTDPIRLTACSHRKFHSSALCGPRKARGKPFFPACVARHLLEGGREEERPKRKRQGRGCSVGGLSLFGTLRPDFSTLLHWQQSRLSQRKEANFAKKSPLKRQEQLTR